MSQCTRDILFLHLPLRKLGIGTYVQRDPSDGVTQPGENPYHPIATATLNTTVFDVVHMFSERGISAVPIIDENGVVVNLYETVDVIVRACVCKVVHHPIKWPSIQTLVHLGAYQALDLTIAEALNQRSPDFPGVVICTASDSIGTLLQLIKKRRVHRLVVVEGEVSGFGGRLSSSLMHSIVRRKSERVVKRAGC